MVRGVLLDVIHTPYGERYVPGSHCHCPPSLPRINPASLMYCVQNEGMNNSFIPILLRRHSRVSLANCIGHICYNKCRFYIIVEPVFNGYWDQHTMSIEKGALEVVHYRECVLKEFYTSYGCVFHICFMNPVIL